MSIKSLPHLGTARNGEPQVRNEKRFAPTLLAAASLIAGTALWQAAWAGPLDWYNQGTALAKEHKDRDAIRMFDATIKALPQFHQPYNNKGACLLSLGYPDKALECFNQALKLEPKAAAIWQNRGIAYYKLGKNKEAIADFNKAISLPRNSPLGSYSIYMDRGMAYAGLGQYKEAYADLTKTMRCPGKDQQSESLRRVAGLKYREVQMLQQDAFGVHKSRAIVSLDKSEYAHSLEYLNKALLLKPDNAQAIALRAEAYTGLGKRAEALKDIDRAIELEPKNGDNFITRARIHILNKQYTDAIADTTEANNLGLKTARVYRTRAIAEYLASQPDAALKDLDLAISQNARDTESYFLKACIATASGDKDKAFEDGSKYLSVTDWNGPLSSQALAVAYFAKSQDSPDEALKLLDTRPKNGDMAGKIIGLLKGEKTEAEVKASCTTKTEKDGVTIVDAWSKLRKSNGDKGAMSKLNLYLAAGNPLETTFVLATAVAKQVGVRPE